MATKTPDFAKTLRSATPSSFQFLVIQRFSFTLTPLFARPPLFPPSVPAQRLLQEPPAKSKFLTVGDQASKHAGLIS